MLHLLPLATSRASRIFGVIGLDTRHYRWSVVSGPDQKWRGVFTAEYFAHGASLEIDAARYRMEREKRGLVATEFRLMSSSGTRLANAVRRVRGIVARETTVQVGATALTMAAGNRNFTFYNADNRSIGSVQIVREGWTVRQSNGYLNFADDEITEPVQVFLFWLCIYRDIDSNASD